MHNISHTTTFTKFSFFFSTPIEANSVQRHCQLASRHKFRAKSYTKQTIQNTQVVCSKFSIVIHQKSTKHSLSLNISDESKFDERKNVSRWLNKRSFSQVSLQLESAKNLFYLYMHTNVFYSMLYLQNLWLTLVCKHVLKSMKVMNYKLTQHFKRFFCL